MVNKKKTMHLYLLLEFLLVTTSQEDIVLNRTTNYIGYTFGNKLGKQFSFVFENNK